MSLDINTPRGQESLQHEIEVASFWERTTGWKYVHTNKSRDVPVDALLLTPASVIAGVAEMKVRYNVDEKTFFETWGGEWLITMDKIVESIKVAKLLRVPYVGFLYLRDAGVLFSQRIADENGLFCVPFRVYIVIPTWLNASIPW
jgi:hypothetical protein